MESIKVIRAVILSRTTHSQDNRIRVGRMCSILCDTPDEYVHSPLNSGRAPKSLYNEQQQIVMIDTRARSLFTPTASKALKVLFVKDNWLDRGRWHVSTVRRQSSSASFRRV